MLRTAFFIVQRPLPLPGAPPQSEAKEVETDMKGLDVMLAPIEAWTYVEEITGDYARAQSMMHWAYGGKIQETGHKTQGHLCVTEQDKVIERKARGGQGSSFLSWHMSVFIHVVLFLCLSFRWWRRMLRVVYCMGSCFPVGLIRPWGPAG